MDLIIPNSVTTINSYAFSGCTGLNTVTIPNSVTNIGDNTFSGCLGLTSIEIPNSVQSIGVAAFDGCSGLYSVTIGNSVSYINSYVFRNCSSLTSVSIPNNLTAIGECAFQNCSSLSSVIIPNNVTIIRKSAFDGCSSIISITIPNNVTDIELYAFRSCTSLKSLTIGSGVKNIKSQVFASCGDLTDVYCLSEEVPTTYSDPFNNSFVDFATLHVPAVSIDEYKTTTPWSSFGTIVALNGDDPIGGDDPIVEKCATPTITYANGKVRFASETEGVEYVPTVMVTPNQQLKGDELEIGGTFTVSVYAVKEGFDNSDTATMTINMAQMGDVNADGQVSIADVTSLVNAILGK